MRAISLSRPWPYAFLHLGKRLENRQQKNGRMPPMCRHRGPLLLHAAKSWDDEAAEWMARKGVLSSGDLFTGLKLRHNECHQHSVIFARCRAVGHVEPGAGGCAWIEMGSANGTHRHVTQVSDGRHIRVRDSREHPPYRELDELAQFAVTLDLRWWMGGYALVLTDVEPTPLVSCRGALGLWTPPADVLAQLGAAA